MVWNSPGCGGAEGSKTVLIARNIGELQRLGSRTTVRAVHVVRGIDLAARMPAKTIARGAHGAGACIAKPSSTMPVWAVLAMPWKLDRGGQFAIIAVNIPHCYRPFCIPPEHDLERKAATSSTVAPVAGFGQGPGWL